MNFEKSYGVKDPQRLAQWFEHDDGGEFFIAPLNNTRQMEENLKLMTVSQIETGLDESVYEAKVKSCDILAKTVLLDWKQVEGNDGEEIDYSPEIGLETLYQFDEFREWVVDHATSLQTEQAEKKEAITKN